MFKGFSQIADVLVETYGVGPALAHPTTCLWAADRLYARGVEIDTIKGEIKAMNRFRARRGMIPVYVPFGSRFF